VRILRFQFVGCAKQRAANSAECVDIDNESNQVS
jgi:hypothetical protein